MIRAIVFLAAICSVAMAQDDSCNFKSPTQDIDWSKVNRGPWKWALYTPDEFQDIFLCSEVFITGLNRRNNIGGSFTLTQRYGEQKHQVYRLAGTYQSPSVYMNSQLAQSWRNIISYKLPFEESERILNQTANVPNAGNVVFFTDYKNYFVSATCMPTGHLTVVAYTMHKRVTPMLERRIRGVLKQNNITESPVKLNCKKIINKRLRQQKRQKTRQ